MVVSPGCSSGPVHVLEAQQSFKVQGVPSTATPKGLGVVSAANSGVYWPHAHPQTTS